MKRFCKNFCFGALMACIPATLLYLAIDADQESYAFLGVWAMANSIGWLYGEYPD